MYVSFISPQLTIFKHTFIVDFCYKQVAGFFHLYPFMIESCVLCQHSDYLQISKPIMHTINDTFRPSSEVSPCSHTLLIYCNNIYNYNELYKKLSIEFRHHNSWGFSSVSMFQYSEFVHSIYKWDNEIRIITIRCGCLYALYLGYKMTIKEFKTLYHCIKKCNGAAKCKISLKDTVSMHSILLRAVDRFQ